MHLPKHVVSDWIAITLDSFGTKDLTNILQSGIRGEGRVSLSSISYEPQRPYEKGIQPDQ